MRENTISKKNIILIMISLMISLLLAALDSTIVGTAMPKIIGDLHGMEHYTWPFSIYMLCSTIAILIFGKLSDIYGRKLIMITGIVIFLLSSVLCGMSQNMIHLIIFRGIQGLGGGILVSNVYIIVGELFPPAKRGKYMGILSSMWGLSSVIGPAIGGIITDLFTWRWVFYVNIPLGIIALILLSTAMPNIRYDKKKPIIDLRGISVFTLSVVSLFMALTFGGNEYAWLSPPIIGLFILTFILVIFLIMIERKAEEPIFPPLLFSSGIFNMSSIIMILTGAVMFCGIIYVPLFIQTVLGKSATGSGGITTPMMLGLAIASIVTGQLISLTGKYKIFAVTSIILILMGCMLFSTMDENTSGLYILLYSAIFGIGTGGIIPVINIATQNAFPNQNLGIVTSSMQFFRRIGATVGTVIFGQVLNLNMNAGFASLDFAQMPQSVISLIKNPRSLTNESAVNSIRSILSPEKLSLFNELISKAKDMLVHSIQVVFIFSIVIIAITLLISLFLKQIPLKRRTENIKIST